MKTLLTLNLYSLQNLCSHIDKTPFPLQSCSFYNCHGPWISLSYTSILFLTVFALVSMYLFWQYFLQLGFWIPLLLMGLTLLTAACQKCFWGTLYLLGWSLNCRQMGLNCGITFLYQNKFRFVNRWSQALMPGVLMKSRTVYVVD